MTALGFVQAFKRRFTRSFGRAALPAALVAMAFATGISTPARAQDFNLGAAANKQDGQMLVESDQLVYDYDADTISAVGNVKIYYVGYTLEAERVIYIKITAKLIATGGVKMTDPTGVVLYADEIDITDDFRDGFVGSLRVDTPDDTHFAAARAERIQGEQTVFYNGVYTACEPCKENPEKPPLWQVKSAKIVVDDKEKEIHFHNASFEFFGVPMAWIPYFTTADPSIKRKTGLLAPDFGYSDMLGYSVSAPYFINLAPSYDITLTPTYYSNQGFLGEVEWRQRLRNGQYTLQMAGISQDDPKAFLKGKQGTFSQSDFRGGLRSTGSFDINRYWEFGWDGTISTDRAFTRDYSVLNDDKNFTTSEVHLTGLRDRNYLDVRAEYFEVLTDNPASKYAQGRQAVVTPVIDYNRVFDNPVLGGQLSLRSNVTVLSRDESDPFKFDGETYYHGLAGDYVRATKQVDWERKMIGPAGSVVTTFASLRGDVFSINPEGSDIPGSLTSQENPTRFMPTVGAEFSYPVMASLPSSTHVVEPIAQIIARPDEPLAGRLPNDDAQSLVFDDSNLFEHDKFSGDDRVEGGTRVNYGVRYTGTFDNGMTLGGTFGQSQMIAGRNSFAVSDISDVGAYSGLETRVSDYVGNVSLDTGRGTRLSMTGRFDEKDFTVNYGEVQALTTAGAFTAAAAYVYLREQPTAGLFTPTSLIKGSASVRVMDRWRVFGSADFDLSDEQLRRNSLGLAYDDSCVSLSIAYSETRGTDIPDRKIVMKLLLRTLADGQVSTQLQ